MNYTSPIYTKSFRLLWSSTCAFCPSGTLGSPRASGSSQVLPPPLSPPSTNKEGQSHGSTTPSSSKTAASAEYKDWTMNDTRLGLSVSSTPKDLHMDNNMAPDAQPLEEDRPATPKPAWSIPSSDLHVPKNNGASALASTYSPPPEDSLLARTGDMAMFMDWHNVSKPLPLCGPPSQVTIQSDFFLDKDLKYLRYDSKGSRPALSILNMKAAYYPDVVLEQMMIMRFNEIHKLSDGTLHQIDEALDYRFKEFKVDRMNPGLNTRFWTRKDMDQSKEFMFAIQKRLKTRRIFCNLQSFVGGREKASDHDYILLPFMPSNNQSSDDKDAGEVPYKGDECVTSTDINTGSLNINNVGPNDPKMPSLEDTGIFDDAYDDKDVGAKANTNNLEFTTVFSPIPTTRVAIGTKWVFRNKKAERGIVIRNKAKLVAQGYTQEEGIDYDEVFAPVARIKAIRIFLAYASFMGFIVYQMYIKSVFLYGTIEEEVYVCQPPGFQDPHFPNEVYKVKQKDDGIFISQDKYVADILKKFDFTTVKTTSTPIEPNKTLIKDAEAEDVDVHLYISMIGSLMYLTAFRPDIMFVIYACARFQITPKTSHLHAVKRIFLYLKGQPKLGLWYPRESPFDLEAFSDSDYARASLDRKCTTGAFHSKTKHIEIRHHFIRDSYEKKLIQVIKIHTDHNVADLLTKAFDNDGIQVSVVSLTYYGKLMLLSINLQLLVMVSAVKTSAKDKTVNDDVWLQALVDGKVTVNETSIRRDLRLDDAEVLKPLPRTNLAALWHLQSSA
nr:hypothetical protein [Tanacetum cinerariifolium]